MTEENGDINQTEDKAYQPARGLARIQSDPRDVIEILVSIDEAYIPVFKTMLYSLRINNPGEHFRLYLMHKDIPPEAISALGVDVSHLGVEFVPFKVDDRVLEGLPTSDRYPMEMYYRLMAPLILRGYSKRVIYLDPDTLIINSIRPLWELDLGEYAFGAAAHTWFNEFAHEANKVRLGTDHRYFNSGVLLIDIDAAAELIDLHDVAEYALAHERMLVLPDQDVFNALYGKYTFALDDAAWNLDARYCAAHYMRSTGEVDIDWILENSTILHFCGRPKPWQDYYPFKLGLLYRHYQARARALLGEQ